MADIIRRGVTNSNLISIMVGQFGAIETLRYFIRQAKASAASMKVGIASDNTMLAVKDFEKLVEALSQIDALVERPEDRKSIDEAVKANIKQN